MITKACSQLIACSPEGEGSDEVVALVEGAVRILRAMGVTSEAGRWRERALMPTGR